jgi:GTPase SAR1 family protein
MPGSAKHKLVYLMAQALCPKQQVVEIGAYFAAQKCEWQPERTVAIWDTAGEEKFDSLTSFYCRNAEIALIFCDSLMTVKDLERFQRMVRRDAPATCRIAYVFVSQDSPLWDCPLDRADSMSVIVDMDSTSSVRELCECVLERKTCLPSESIC